MNKTICLVMIFAVLFSISAFAIVFDPKANMTGQGRYTAYNFTNISADVLEGDWYGYGINDVKDVRNLTGSNSEIQSYKGLNTSTIKDMNNNTGYYQYYIHSEAEEIIARDILTAEDINSSGTSCFGWGTGRYICIATASTAAVMKMFYNNGSVAWEIRETSGTLEINHGLDADSYIRASAGTIYLDYYTRINNNTYYPISDSGIQLGNPSEKVVSPTSGIVAIEARSTVSLNSDINANDAVTALQLNVSSGNTTYISANKSLNVVFQEGISAQDANFTKNVSAKYFDGNISWAHIDNGTMPSACPASSALTALDTVITCTDSWIDAAGDTMTGDLKMSLGIHVVNDTGIRKISEDKLLIAMTFNEGTIEINTLNITGRDLSGAGDFGMVDRNTVWLNDSGFNGGGCLNFSNGSSSRAFNFTASDPRLKFSYLDSFTMSIWVNPNSLAQTWGVTYAPGIAAQNNKYGFTSGSSGVVSFSVRQGTGLSSTTSLKLKEWTHLVGVYNASSRYISLYKNGVLVDSDDASAESFTAPTTAFGIGGTVTGGNGIGFNGTIDNFAVWNRSLTSDEIYALYNTRWEKENDVFGLEGTVRTFTNGCKEIVNSTGYYFEC